MEKAIPDLGVVADDLATKLRKSLLWGWLPCHRVVV
jgi:hypothetical protein